MSVTMKSLESLIGQLANSMNDQLSGKFPSDTEPNLKDHRKAITPRTGKELEPSKSKENKTKENEMKKSE